MMSEGPQRSRQISSKGVLLIGKDNIAHLLKEYVIHVNQ